jgi:hypothetical protein
MKLEAEAVRDVLGRINLDHEKVWMPDHVGPVHEELLELGLM